MKWGSGKTACFRLAVKDNSRKFDSNTFKCQIMEGPNKWGGWKQIPKIDKLGGQDNLGGQKLRTAWSDYKETERTKRGFCKA